MQGSCSHGIFRWHKNLKHFWTVSASLCGRHFHSYFQAGRSSEQTSAPGMSGKNWGESKQTRRRRDLGRGGWWGKESINFFPTPFPSFFALARSFVFFLSFCKLTPATQATFQLKAFHNKTVLFRFYCTLATNQQLQTQPFVLAFTFLRGARVIVELELEGNFTRGKSRLYATPEFSL